MKNESSLVNIISTEIINTSVDIGIDYAELLLEELAKDTMQTIPIIKTIVGIGKIGFCVRELFNAQKLLVFIRELNLNKIEEKQLSSFKHKFKSDSKFKNSVTEHLIIMNDRFIALQKSKILANLFASYINQNINWERFQDLSYCLDSIHPRGLIILNELGINDFMKSSEEMIQDKGEAQLVISSGIGYESGYTAAELVINDFGKDLFNFGLNKL